MRARVQSRPRSTAGWWVVLAAAALVGLVAALGGFLPRDDEPVPVVEAGDVVEMDLATVAIDEVSAGAETIDLTITVTSAVHVPLDVTRLVELVDDEGSLVIAPGDVLLDTGAFSSEAQPGVTETFSLSYTPDRAAVGDVRIELWDGTFVPRDETSFGLFDNIHDERLVAVVEVQA